MWTRRKVIEVLVFVLMTFGFVSLSLKPIISEFYQLMAYNPMKYGFLIFLFATPAYVIISGRRTFNEWLCICLIGLGIFSLCQPFNIYLYHIGFQILLVGTLGFIFVSHMKP